MELLLEKFKEKNAAVGKAAAEALTAMHKYCWALLDVAESLTGEWKAPDPSTSALRNQRFYRDTER